MMNIISALQDADSKKIKTMKQLFILLLTIFTISLSAQTINFTPVDTIGVDSIIYQMVTTSINNDGDTVIVKSSQLYSQEDADDKVRSDLERLHKTYAALQYERVRAFLNAQSNMAQLLTLKSNLGAEFYSEQETLYKSDLIGSWSFYDSYSATPINVNLVDNDGILEFQTIGGSKIAEIDLKNRFEFAVTFVPDVPGTSYDHLNGLSYDAYYGYSKELNGQSFGGSLQTSNGLEAIIWLKN